MPTISKFYGILIRMHYDDHNPPHFHAIYGGYDVSYQISPLAKERGRFPKHAHSLVMKWARMHRNELMFDWQAAAEKQALRKIRPLE